jgi:hypothetical protein
VKHCCVQQDSLTPPSSKKPQESFYICLGYIMTEVWTPTFGSRMFRMPHSQVLQTCQGLHWRRNLVGAFWCARYNSCGFSRTKDFLRRIVIHSAYHFGGRPTSVLVRHFPAASLRLGVPHEAHYHHREDDATTSISLGLVRCP